MILLIAEIVLRTLWWALYTAYCFIIYLMYGKQETLEDRVRVKEEMDKKNLDELKSEISELRDKISQLTQKPEYQNIDSDSIDFVNTALSKSQEFDKKNL